MFDAFQRVESVDKQNGVRKASDEPAEGLQLTFVRLDETVGHRSHDRYTVNLAGHGAAGGIDACDVKGTWLLQPGIGAVHSAQAEIHHLPAARRVNHSSSLGRRKCSHLDLIHEKRFDDLSLRQRSHDLNDRLVRKNHGPLRNCVDVAGEFEVVKTV